MSCTFHRYIMRQNTSAADQIFATNFVEDNNYMYAALSWQDIANTSQQRLEKQDLPNAISSG